MLQYIYPSHRHDARTLTQIKGQVIQKRLTLKPPPSKTHTMKQMRKTELNVKHRVQNQCVLGLDMTSRLIGTGHFRPPTGGQLPPPPNILTTQKIQDYKYNDI